MIGHGRLIPPRSPAVRTGKVPAAGFATLFFVILLLPGCSLSPRGDVERLPAVRALFASPSPDLAGRLLPYQHYLDSIVGAGSRAHKGRTFRAVAGLDSAAPAAYEIILKVDSVYVVPEETQRRVLGIRDSVLAGLDRPASAADSAAAPASAVQRTMASVASRLGLDSVPGAMGRIGLIIVEDAVKSNLDRRTQNRLAAAVVRPRLVGEIRVVRIRGNRTTWRQKAVIEDEYRRVVNYAQQVDMLVRGLVAKMRFEYETPFLADYSHDR